MKQEFGHPTTLYYFIDCANSFIAVLTLLTTINCFNLSNSKPPTKESGLTWYRNFMRRRKYQLESQRSKRKHKLIEYWKTPKNFIYMYDRVYAAMVDAKVATLMDESYY